MGLPKKNSRHYARKIITMVFVKSLTIAPVFLFLLCQVIILPAQAIHLNSQKWLTSIIWAQASTADPSESFNDSTVIGNLTTEDKTANTEIENTLAQKAEMGQRKTGNVEDRFSTILFYSISIGCIGLIIILIFFYLNLRHKGEYLKMLRRRLENRKYKKAGS